MQAVDRVAIKLEAKGVFRQQRNAFLVAMLIMIVASMITNTLTNPSPSAESNTFIVTLGGLVSFVIGSILSFGFAGMCLRALEGKVVDFKEIADYLPEWWGILKINFVVAFIVGFGFALLLIPGIIAAILLSQTTYIFIDDPKKPTFQIMRESYELMKNRMGEYFVLMLSFIGWFLLVIVTLGLAAFYVGPYANLTYAAYYQRIAERKTSSVDTKYYEPAASAQAEEAPVEVAPVVVAETVEEAPVEVAEAVDETPVEVADVVEEVPAELAEAAIEEAADEDETQA